MIAIDLYNRHRLLLNTKPQRRMWGGQTEQSNAIEHLVVFVLGLPGPVEIQTVQLGICVLILGSLFSRHHPGGLPEGAADHHGRSVHR